MFGHAYFGGRFFGPRYYGDGGEGTPPEPPVQQEVRGVPTVPLRSKRRREDEEGWHPPQETEAERVERVLRQRRALGIVEEEPQEPLQPAKPQAVRRARADPALSRAAELVPVSRSEPRAAVSHDLSPEQVEELRGLVALEAQRRNDDALAVILLSLAAH